MRTALIALGLLIVATLISGLATRAEFRAETSIAAPPGEVWAVLTDTAGYPDWNPVFVQVDGAYSSGATVTNHVRFPDGSIVVIPAEVETFAANETLLQVGGTPLILTFANQWTLTPTSLGTRVTLYEVNEGLMMWFWDESWVEPAYQGVVEALKARVEG